MLLKRLIEPRLGEILERIAGILGGASAAVLHSPCCDALLAADTLARPSPSRRMSTLPSPLLPRPVALVATRGALCRVHSDHGHLTTATAIPGQHWGIAGITGIRALIDSQQLVCRIDDVHAKRMVSPCSPDRASNLPICWLPWLLLPPPLLLPLLPRLSAEPTSLPANSSFMSPPRVTLPGHANSRIFLAREPPVSAHAFFLFYSPWRFSAFPSFLPVHNMDGWILRRGNDYGEGRCRTSGRRTLVERLAILGLRQMFFFWLVFGPLENCSGWGEWMKLFGQVLMVKLFMKVFLLKLGWGILCNNFFWKFFCYETVNLMVGIS